MKKILIIILLLGQMGFVSGAWGSSTEAQQLAVLAKKEQVLKAQILALEKELKKPELIGQTKRVLREKISKRNQELVKTQDYFRYISSGLHIESKRSRSKKDLLKEFKNIVEPLVTTLGQISERPRQISKIRGELEYIAARREKLRQAIVRINNLLVGSELSVPVKTRLQSLVKEYDQELATLDLTQKQLRLDLSELDQSNQSLISIWSKTLFHFFKTKGINLLLAFIAFLSIWVVLIRIKNRVLEMKFLDEFQWAVRPLNVLYTSLIFILSLLVAILVLYVRNDWFLVTLIVIFIVGFIWSIKQWIPQFIHKGKLLLNLGPIREHELVVWKEVPYQISKLSYFSTLANPLLAGGKLRISIDELSLLQSRPILSDEVWFPCAKGDFVKLDDGVFGEIVQQTPEYIILRSYKENEIFYKIQDFLHLRPSNFSKGFVIEKSFSLSMITRGVIENHLIEKLEAFFLEKLSEFEISSIQIILDELKNGLVGFTIYARYPGEQARYKIIIEKRMISYLFEYLSTHKIDLPAESMVINLQKKIDKEGFEE